MSTLREDMLALAQRARDAARKLAGATAESKNLGLHKMADAITGQERDILAVNAEEVEQARAAGLTGAMLDRLTLNPRRVAEMVQGLRDIAAQPDPVGEVDSESVRPNGLRVGRMRVPLGVIAMIYEARPNVTADAAGLCLKAGNAVILRGGSEATRSNRAIGAAIAAGLQAAKLPVQAVQVVQVPDRQAVTDLLSFEGLIDCVIPRGGRAFLKWVSETSRVPVIRHGEGNCHVYVDHPADIRSAGDIVFNAKVQRPGVCNAAETLLVHAQSALALLPQLLPRLAAAGVELRCDEAARAFFPAAKPALPDDWATEFLDLILAVKVVADFEEALEHIERYGTGHSEAIVTNDYRHAERFLREVDAAAVLINASTRLVDGGQFGLGAEIGISTQKLHARGPMGVRELTTQKFVVRGNGQIRE